MRGPQNLGRKESKTLIGCDNMMSKKTRKPLLCLDLEGTLISNAVSQIPRPGLYDFLESVSGLYDLMLYTSVSRVRVHAIQDVLIEEQVVPTWFKDLPVIHPEGTIKYKAHCSHNDAILLDDQAAVIAPGEEGWWIPIEEYLPPYADEDCELAKAFANIKSRLAGS